MNDRLRSAAVSALVSLTISLVAWMFMREYVHSEAERVLRDREEQFVGNVRDNVVRMRADFGMPPKSIDSIEDVFETLTTLTK